MYIMEPNQYPQPVVGAFIFNEKGEVLLVRSPKWENGTLWAVPGGHVEWGETIKAAVEREAFEEVGLKVNFDSVFGVFDVIFPEKYHQKMHFIFLECRCLVKGKQIVKIDGKEIVEAKWFALKEGLQLPLEENTQKSLLLLSEQ
jgi:nucleoside triphosphatase